MKTTRLVSGLLALALTAAASDERVALTATATPEYTRRKFAGDKIRTETYVLMEGKFSGGLTADRSIEQMPFRRIAEYLAPELAKQSYLPTTDPKGADLLLVVHWGTTVPRVTTEQMRATLTIDLNGTEDGGPPSGGSNADAESYKLDSPEWRQQRRLEELDRVTDQLRDQSREKETARTLGYDRELMRVKNTIFSSEQEATMRSDLGSERYYIIVRAYDLKEKAPAGGSRPPVWTLYANMSSPGQSFATAINRMSLAAKNYFGRDTLEMKNVRAPVREGNVKLGPLVLEGETPAEHPKADDDKKPK